MNISLNAEHIRGILLDVEGTTTPITFVYDTLFPFVRARINDFLRANESAADVREIINLLKLDHESDKRANLMTPEWQDQPIEYINWLMDQDRKTTALKDLQGKIWLE